MIKFTEITKKNIKTTAEKLFDSSLLAEEIMNSFSFDDDLYYAVANFSSCMLVRVFDLGRYVFLYPFELSRDARVEEAILEMTEYAMKEELDFVLCDVPTDGVGKLLSLGFRHLDVDLEDEGAYRVRVKTECTLLKSVPCFEIEGLSIGEIDASCEGEYAALCRDPFLNRFWGYDYREDLPNADDEFFINMAKGGFVRGVSLTLALKKDGIFVGIIELFAFDGRGGCEFAVKIAREHQGRGYGSVATKAAIEVAKRTGLVRLFCDVMTENVRSLNLMKKFFEQTESKHPDRKRFMLDF